MWHGRNHVVCAFDYQCRACWSFWVLLPRISVEPVATQFERIQASPMEVTSDTPEYCQHLLDRVSDLVRLPLTRFHGTSRISRPKASGCAPMAKPAAESCGCEAR